MKHLDKVIERDPLQVRQYESGSDNKVSRTIYIFLVLIPIFLIASLVLYVLASATANGDIAVNNQLQAVGDTSTDYVSDSTPTDGDTT